MKILHKNGRNTLVILDDNNYAIGNIYKDKKGNDQMSDAKYFGTIECAVKYIAKLAANKKARGLNDWLKQYKKVLDDLSALMKGG